MFFFIGGVPKGKWGIFYGAVLLIFSFWLFIFYVRPAVMETIPTENLPTLSLDPSIAQLFTVGGAILFIVALLILIIVAHEEYKKWKSHK